MSIRSIKINKHLIYHPNHFATKDTNSKRFLLNVKIKKIISDRITTLKNMPKNVEKLSQHLKIKYRHSFSLSEIKQHFTKKILRLSPVRELTRDKIGKEIDKIIKDQAIPTLYLYSSGGGGHKSAKDAKLEANLKIVFEGVCSAFNVDDPIQEDARLKNLSEFIKYCKKMEFVQEVDVLHDYLGRIGKWSSKQWDNAQIAGNTLKQEKLASKQWLSDIAFSPVIFFSTLKSLCIHKPLTIVSTQAMATPAILLAIKAYNIFYKPKNIKDTKLHLYMTDMPTKYSGHFFNSLKNLPEQGGKKYLILHAPKSKSEIDWQISYNFPNEQVRELTTNELPVRPAFLQAAENYQPSIRPKVQLKVSCKQELDLLKEVLKHQNSEFNQLTISDSKIQAAQSFNYLMKPGEESYFLMLGSQPTKKAIKKYARKFIQLAIDNPNKNYHLFAFTGKFEENKKCFYKEISQYIKEIKPWPANLKVIPLSFQDPIQLVSLELQCHTITRSGGSTVMELFVIEEVCKTHNLPNKKRFIHAQKVKNRTLENSLPVWEKGNYFFLQQELGKGKVNVTSPGNFFG